MTVRSCGFALVIALVACDQGERPSPAPTVVVAPGFEDLPAFPKPWTDKFPYDCSITGVFEKLLPSIQVETCGLLALDAKEADHTAAVDCMKRAEAARRPYLLAREFQGIDSAIARARLVTFESGSRVMYEAMYDDNPCGGSCGERGGTYVTRCRVAPDGSNLFTSKWWEKQCEDGDIVESCAVGQISRRRLPHMLAEGMRNAVIGDSPATLAPLGPVRIGAPRSIWESAAVKRLFSQIESSGLVYLSDTRWANQRDRIEALIVSFAGPCSRVRALLQAKWGPPDGVWWVNRTLHQRAQLELQTCRLRIEAMSVP
jgi:hypothetical protein